MKVRMILLIFASAIVIFACSSRGSVNKSAISDLAKIASRNFDIEIKKLLPEGKIPFEVLDSMEITVRQTELAYKFAEAYQENIDVFNSYLEKTRNNQKANYPENEILSENEFLELMNFLNNEYAPKLLPTQTEIVEVMYSDDNRISFKSNGKLEILNLITYHAETNTFDFGNYYTLKFIDTLNVETNTNTFREPWKGYHWEFSEPKDLEMPTVANITKMSMKQFKIRLGKLTSSEKTFMIVELKDFREGNWAINVEITIRMK